MNNEFFEHVLEVYNKFMDSNTDPIVAAKLTTIYFDNFDMETVRSIVAAPDLVAYPPKVD